MPQLPKLIAGAISARLPTQNSTGRVWALNSDGTVAVEVLGGSILNSVRTVASYAPALDDVVVMTWDTRGLVITGKVGTNTESPGDYGNPDLYYSPRIDMVPLFTGTWRDGLWQTAVDNECQFGQLGPSQIMGCAYYGRVLQGTQLFSSDSYFLSIVRLPSPGLVPTKVTIGLLAGQAPTDAGPTVLDTVTGLTLTGPGMGDQAESLSFQSQGWEDRFTTGEAGGLALMHDATMGDHLTRVAGAYGCSMNVSGYPAWVL